MEDKWFFLGRSLWKIHLDHLITDASLLVAR
jgi:hypothetical protein